MNGFDDYNMMCGWGEAFWVGLCNDLTFHIENSLQWLTYCNSSTCQA